MYLPACPMVHQLCGHEVTKGRGNCKVGNGVQLQMMPSLLLANANLPLFSVAAEEFAIILMHTQSPKVPSAVCQIAWQGLS